MYQITSYTFIDQKQSKNLLFLHGWGCNLNYMLPLALKIKNANLLIIDLPGFGKNDPLLKSSSLADFIESIDIFLKAKKIVIHGIIGHSFGGKIACLLAAKYSISFLCLFSPSIYHKKRTLKYYFLVYSYKLIKKIKFLKFLLPLFGTQDYKELNDVMKHTMSLIINEDITKQLKQLKMPIFLLFGKKDTITPPYLAKKIKKNCVDCHIELIDGNHFCYLQHIDKVSKIIESLVHDCC